MLEFTLRVDPLPSFIELHVRLPSTVRVKPAPMTMSSVACGMVPPGHGALGVAELQFPVPVVVTVAANVAVVISKTVANVTNERHFQCFIDSPLGV